MLPFVAVGTGPAGLALRATQDCGLDGPIFVFCRGIEIGRLELDGSLPEGAIVEIPVLRFPRVPLPTELRVAAAVDGPDLVAPWHVESPDAVLALLGPPEVTVDDLRLDHGVLRGTAREPRNGLLEPILYARINGSAARTIEADPAVILPEGGCAFRFALALRPTDLTEAGLSVQIHLIGQSAPIASYAWTRSGPGEVARRLAEFEGRLEQIETEATAAQQHLLETLRRRLDLQQERIDSFIDAAATLLLDRLAGVGGATLQPRDAVRLLLDTASPPPIDDFGVAAGARQLVIGADGGQFGAGWHRPENHEGGAFRWMDRRGLLLNPDADRPVAGVTVHVQHVYGGAAPMVQASLDAQEAMVSVERTGDQTYELRITPPADGCFGRVLRLTSLTSGCPALDTGAMDRRTLSIAVSRAVFDYSA